MGRHITDPRLRPSTATITLRTFLRQGTLGAVDSEFRYQLLQLRSHLTQFMRRLLRISRTGCRAGGSACHPPDVLGDLARPLCRLGDVAAHFVGGRGLLLDGRGEGWRNPVVWVDDAGDVLDAL